MYEVAHAAADATADAAADAAAADAAAEAEYAADSAVDPLRLARKAETVLRGRVELASATTRLEGKQLSTNLFKGVVAPALYFYLFSARHLFAPRVARLVTDIALSLLAADGPAAAEAGGGPGRASIRS